jgi:alkylresorcinol/alkylpyrone synthase
MRILTVGRAFPPHRYPQSALTAGFARYWGERHHNTERVERLHAAVGVEARHTALPMDAYETLDFAAASRAFLEVGTAVAADAVQRALDEAGLHPRDVDALFFVTVTGVASPTIDARLVNRLGMRPDVKRTPVFGLGCVAGAAGLARMADYLEAWPDHVAVLVSVELCSLTLQRDDVSVANLIAAGLFGDGAAAVVATGGGGSPSVRATRSRLYPDTEHVMGWEVVDGGFRLVLTPAVPEMVRRHLREDVDAFLDTHRLSRADVAAWVCHPGGPKVLEATREALEVPDDAVALSWRSMREVGNLSSASVLLVLEDTLRERRPPPGTPGVLLAMGPGFCSELVLLEW